MKDTSVRAQSSSSAAAKDDAASKTTQDSAATTTTCNEHQQLLLNPKCIFCKILSNEIPSSQVYRDEQCLIMMDIHPIRPGHCLIIPTRHYQNIMDMPPEVAQHMMKLAHQLTGALTTSTSNSTSSSMDKDQDQFTCHGTNLLWNNGRAAWQTVLHAHLHVIPRQRGDSWAFCFGLVKHFLSLLGLVRPANRQELDRLAGIFRKAFLKHHDNIKKTS